MVTNNSVNEATAATGKVLQGQGVGTASAFSTATYPATATGTGTIIRADGTNWVATTATYPTTAGTSGNVLTSDGTNWSSSAASAGFVKQQVRTAYNTTASTASVLPADNTIPQNTEGAELMTLAITPTNTNSVLRIEATVQLSNSIADQIAIALFQDSTANALSASVATIDTQWSTVLTLSYYMTAGTTSSTTFKIRFGPNTGTTTAYVNSAGATQLFNGKNSTTLIITEYSS